MKTKIKHIIASMILVFTMSCNDYIDIVPDNVATFDLAFNNRENAEQFFFTLYGYLPQFGNPNNNVALLSGDEVWPNSFAAGNWPGVQIAQGFQNVTSPLFNHWGGDPHTALRDINIFLERIYDVPDMTDDEKDRWVAEAKFLKAYYHFHLMRMYGPIPIIDENIDISEDISGVRIERDLVDDVVDYTVSLLDEAIEGLPSEIVFDITELGRATKPIAAMLKAKVLAFAASPLFNGNTVYSTWTNDAGEPYINQTFDANKWQLAADACLEAINYAHDGGHSLFYWTNFAPSETLSTETMTKMNLRGAITEEWNTETIWGQLYPTHGLSSLSFVRIDLAHNDETLGRVASYYSPPLHIAEQFYSENGVPIDEDTTYDYDNRYELTFGDADHSFLVRQGYETIGLHLNRSLRFYASMGGDGILSYDINNDTDDTNLFVADFKLGGISGFINQRNFSQTGYLPKKLVHWRDFIANDQVFDPNDYPFPVYRLADLYLLYAECLNEAQGPSAEVYQYVDLIRARSGMDGVVASWAAYSSNPSKPTNQDGLREIIHQERLNELAFEGHRFWDLRRWFKAHLMLNDTDMNGWNAQGGTPALFYQLGSKGQTQFSIKDYFWPISENDILQNPNLDQSFGW